MQRISPAPQVLTRNDAAKICQISVRTIDKFIASGELPVIRFNTAVRIAHDDLQRFLESRKGNTTQVA